MSAEISEYQKQMFIWLASLQHEINKVKPQPDLFRALYLIDCMRELTANERAECNYRSDK